MDEEKLIDEIAAYIERYRTMPSMTSHRIARHILSMTDDVINPCKCCRKELKVREEPSKVCMNPECDEYCKLQ
jgi:hypothetical protein